MKVAVPLSVAAKECPAGVTVVDAASAVAGGSGSGACQAESDGQDGTGREQGA
ncbi:hypothetical protein GCM10020221_23400 [Streptomyces thioluteus]|uniref:Uncharacterized protein n=1 Tax=Streptomyces thioluteus TaxID=66431 RepID=A0ABP6JCQ4_STRTU